VNPDGADGSFGLFLWQGVGVLATFAWSGGVSFLIFKALGMVMPLRAEEQDEWAGMDMSESGERAYVTSDIESGGERDGLTHAMNG
jgi:ammonium transporter, Amt family